MSKTDMKSIEDVTLSGEIESYIVDPGTGDKIRCYYQDPTEEQRRRLMELEDKAEDDPEAAQEIEELVIDTLFKSEKVTSNSGLAQKQAVIAGLFRALGQNEAIDDAQELMATLQDEGNG